MIHMLGLDGKLEGNELEKMGKKMAQYLCEYRSSWTRLETFF